MNSAASALIVRLCDAGSATLAEDAAADAAAWRQRRGLISSMTVAVNAELRSDRTGPLTREALEALERIAAAKCPLLRGFGVHVLASAVHECLPRTRQVGPHSIGICYLSVACMHK
jgi:hypothetical protein